MVNIAYRAARVQGNLFRNFYKAALPWIVNMPIQQTRKVQMAVYYFSCERDLPEQVASIRSFIRYVGLPEKLIVISDGTYSPESCTLIRKINPCIDVVSFEKFIKKNLPKSVYTYANIHPLGKKLAVLASIPIEQVTIFADSDILFFPDAGNLVSLTKSLDQLPLYLPDCVPALDERILFSSSEKSNPINSGFILLYKPLDWNFALKRLEQVAENPHYFTEQTILHLAVHNNQGIALPHNQFVVSLDDQCIYKDKYAGKKIVLRHYVNPVRHKLWLNVRN